MLRSLCCAAAAALLAAAPAAAWGAKASTGEGINTAGVIDFPTALDQPTTHTFHGTLEVFDLGEPDLRVQNMRYGFQLGNLQLLADGYWGTDPKKFEHGEAKAKLRVLNLDEFRTYAAVGFLGRFVDGTGKARDEKAKAVLDDKTYSLFAVVTAELFPVAHWDAFLLNFYLDNRFGSLGLKVPVYQFIRAVAESDYHHAGDEKDRWRSKVGVELEGEQSFYFQVYYADHADNGSAKSKDPKTQGRVRVQIGTGF